MSRGRAAAPIFKWLAVRSRVDLVADGPRALGGDGGGYIHGDAALFLVGCRSPPLFAMRPGTGRRPTPMWPTITAGSGASSPCLELGPTLVRAGQTELSASLDG